MSDEEIYASLIEHLRYWLFGLPVSELLLPLIKMRFTPDEAEFLSRFPHRPSTIEELSVIYNKPAAELLAAMRPMIGKGFIYQVEGKNAVRYSFPDAIFMFYRMPGWRGENDVWNRELAPLLNRYYLEDMGAEFMGHPTKGLRTIPIAHTVEDTKLITPYEDVLGFIEREDYHSVSTCPCRHRHKLDPAFEACEHETENCLHFGRLGKYIVHNGMGRKISPAETMDILERAAEAGLVHGISNTREGMDTICNCCSCCCLFLEPVKNISPQQRGLQGSNYRIDIDHDTCKACGLCAKRCPTQALELKQKEDTPAVSGNGRTSQARDLKYIEKHPEMCIGCGVCAYKCPTHSLTLSRRETEEDIPANLSELGYRLLNELGRDLSGLF